MQIILAAGASVARKLRYTALASHCARYASSSSSAPVSTTRTDTPAPAESEEPSASSLAAQAFKAQLEAAGVEADGAALDPARALAELRDRGAIRAETVKAIGNTREWKEYLGEVTAQVGLLKMRYATATEKMTPARRMQMSAHVSALHKQLLQEHAESVAEQFVAGLTDEKAKALHEEFNRLDLAGVTITPRELPETPMTFSDAMKNFGELMAASGASGDATAATAELRAGMQEAAVPGVGGPRTAGAERLNRKKK